MPGSPIDVVSTMVALLMMGMNLGVKLFFKSERDASELQEAERQNLEAQLASLRYQVDPHFYMTTTYTLLSTSTPNGRRQRSWNCRK